ncbi:MAG TPA: twin-arginine translocase TatA/TatE family subunit [Acidimicrobiales bacterium]|nr:twin-arginine translocase TatA/TatE family subunit [Acidimicrobiales bacterium]
MLANVGDLPYVIVIALIVLVGGSQLPRIARNVGLAGKEFRKAQAEAEEEQAAKGATPPPPVPLPAAPAPAPTSAAAEGEGSITLTPAQLDALLKAREEQTRGDSGTPSTPNN